MKMIVEVEERNGEIEAEFEVEDIATLIGVELPIHRCRRCEKPVAVGHCCLFCGSDDP